MAWRYFHDGHPADEIRPLTDEEREELRQLASRTAEDIVWPVAIAVLVSFVLGALFAPVGLVGVMVGALLPWLLLGVPVGVHTYQLARDRRLAALGLEDGRALTFFLPAADEDPEEEIDCSVTGMIFGAKRNRWRYCPPLYVMRVAEPVFGGEGVRQLSDDEITELVQYAKLKPSYGCCAVPLALLSFLPFMTLADGALVFILLWLLFIFSFSGGALVIRNEVRIARHFRTALSNPIATRITYEDGLPSWAEQLSGGNVCWTFDGEPAFWRIYGQTPNDVWLEREIRQEEEDD